MGSCSEGGFERILESEICRAYFFGAWVLVIVILRVNNEIFSFAG